MFLAKFKDIIKGELLIKFLAPRKRSIKFQPDSDEDTEKDTSLTASAKKKKRVSWAEKLEHVKLFGGDEKGGFFLFIQFFIVCEICYR
jgi:hypothetical protein